MTRGACRGLALAIAVAFASVSGASCGEPSKPPAVAAASPSASPAASPSAPPAASPASPTAPPAAEPASDDSEDEAPGTCGSGVCELDQFCEDLYKGHDADARGRPLNRKKCMPLPDPCKAKPTCACVTKHVASTHCTDDGGRVYVNDYPSR